MSLMTKDVVGLDPLPDSARIWIFGADREVVGDEAVAFLGAVDAFLRLWAAHGVPLRAARCWRYDRFLVVGVDEASAPPSGCSIDALVHLLDDLGRKHGLCFLGNETVWYRDRKGEIQHASRPEFRLLARRDQVGLDSVVFDNSITTMSQLRTGRWEGVAAERWQATFFG